MLIQASCPGGRGAQHGPALVGEAWLLAGAQRICFWVEWGVYTDWLGLPQPRTTDWAA